MVLVPSTLTEGLSRSVFNIAVNDSLEALFLDSLSDKMKMKMKS